MICYNVFGAELDLDGNDLQGEQLELFITDLINTWKLLLPTIIFEDETPNFCFTHAMILCMTNDEKSEGLAEHLARLHRGRKQDGALFIGGLVHEHLLTQITEIAPSFFTSECPLFMPKGTQKVLELRLDSNIVFYERLNQNEYELTDIFRVKRGSQITLNIGKWEANSGISFQNSINRWKRRTDLQGASFVEGLFSKGNWANLTKDESGNIIGSTGFFPEKLAYITGGLNLTMKIKEYPKGLGNKLLANGTWEGAFGMIQRGEIDVDSTGNGINLERTILLDFPICTHRVISRLIAGKPEGNSLDMWVYLRVFGIIQWSLFLLSMILLAITLAFITTWLSAGSFGMKKGNQRLHKLDSVASSSALVLLFALQMGSHLNGKHWAPRVLTLTMSLLTFVFFVYLCMDITAEMTSGPSEIPIRNFEDVLNYDYRVITIYGPRGYYGNALRKSKPDSAKYKVYKAYIETLPVMDDYQALAEVISDRKTLLYSTLELTVSSPAGKEIKRKGGKLIGLNLDDPHYGIGTIALLKGSEFLSLFNFYILKALEHGIIKKLYKKFHPEMFTDQQFGMAEPQPLSGKNVIFPFICLAFGIFVSFVIAFAEFMKMKLLKVLTKLDAIYNFGQ